MAKTIYAQVSAAATGLQMKQKIHSKKKIPIHQMQLWYNNQQLDDDKPLSHYNIRNSTALSLKVLTRKADCSCSECKWMNEKITLRVTSLSTSFEVTCTLGEPVENLKNTIRLMKSIPVSRQRLVFKNQTLEDHKLLAHYKFTDEEAPDTKPEVQLIIDNGAPTLMERFRNMVSVKGTKMPATTTPTV